MIDSPASRGDSVARIVDRMDGVELTPLRIIGTEGGAVLHGLRRSDLHFRGFGEAYLSLLAPGAIRAWKRHRRMTLNLVVPQGEVRFVVFDDRTNSRTCGAFREVVLSPDSCYARLTVSPGLWLGFQGRGSGNSLLLNVADLEHDPEELDRLPLAAIRYSW